MDKPKTVALSASAIPRAIAFVSAAPVPETEMGKDVDQARDGADQA